MFKRYPELIIAKKTANGYRQQPLAFQPRFKIIFKCSQIGRHTFTAQLLHMPRNPFLNPFFDFAVPLMGELEIIKKLLELAIIHF